MGGKGRERRGKAEEGGRDVRIDGRNEACWQGRLGDGEEGLRVRGNKTKKGRWKGKNET